MGRPLSELSPSTRWVGHPVEFHPEIDSTNLRAEQCARQGAPEGTLILAERQSAGRGRRGRSFFSPGEGWGLYLSLVLRPSASAERLHEHVFAAAVAVADWAAGVVHPSRVSIKWPNDVLIDGRKLSGINAPAEIREGRTTFLVLGIGVNVNTPAEAFPPELSAVATSLRIACRSPVDRTVLAEELLLRLEAELDDVRADLFAAVLGRWRLYFKMRGQPVRIGGPGVPVERTGIAEDVDVEGALILRVGSRRERVVAGDVSLLDALHEEPHTECTDPEPTG